MARYRVLSLDYDPASDSHDSDHHSIARLMRQRPTPHSERPFIRRTRNGNIVAPRSR
jgi:hypothetical protein